MGQYHNIYSTTKKEMLNAHNFNGGIKLLEQSGNYPLMTGFLLLLSNSNGRGGGDININYEYDKTTYKKLPPSSLIKEQETILNAISGRWSGDNIVIQGDYAEKNDKAFINDYEIEQYHDISNEVKKALMINKYLAKEIKNND
jgi:hypothetical protein